MKYKQRNQSSDFSIVVENFQYQILDKHVKRQNQL